MCARKFVEEAHKAFARVEEDADHLDGSRAMCAAVKKEEQEGHLLPREALGAANASAMTFLTDLISILVVMPGGDKNAAELLKDLAGEGIVREYAMEE
ncbi:hypothetical protein POTOM_049808 [Populus tomentosa]|uniref:Uncharacterized protein n=1 Tax=Populus tomentosa TaxID=118781 RepID=A0A8X7YAQ8_POPTO|nr:hypothetical protein POTOM_049808 [Populus tomentosa]